jgi:hypothetical protein
MQDRYGDQQERFDAIVRLLRADPTRSMRSIARSLSIHHSAVCRVRDELDEGPDYEPVDLQEWKQTRPPPKPAAISYTIPGDDEYIHWVLT